MRATGWTVAAAVALAIGCSGTSGSPKSESPPAPKPAADPYRERVETLLRPMIEGEWITGVSIGLIADGQTHLYGLGRLAATHLDAPDGDTIYEIGSVTKVFTSLVLADAVARGVVELDAPASRYLEGVALPAFEGAEITVEQLADHTSGLPRMPANFHPKDPANPFADYGVDDLYEFLAAYQMTRAPGAKYEYSNLATGLLGHLLSRVHEQPFEQLVLERVCEPLGLGDTSIAVDPVDATRVAPGHDGEGKQAKAWDIPTLAGAGALRSTARDMAKFVEANLAADHPKLGPAIKVTHEPRADADAGGGKVGLGWHITSDGTRWHNGQTGGYHSYIAFDAERDIGVVVLANTATPLVDAVGQALMLMLSDRPYEIRLPPTISLPEEELSRYVGTYRLAADFVISVSRQGDQLFAQATGWPGFRLFASSKTDFYLRVVDAQIVFELDADGRPTALILHQGGQQLRGPRL